jgi:hypothetical protein
MSYCALSAFFDIFINLLLHPNDLSASSDFHLLQVITDSMLAALTTSSSPFALLLSEILQKMTAMAKDILIRTESDNSSQSGLTPITPAINTMGYIIDASGGFPPSTISSAQPPTSPGYPYYLDYFTSNVRLGLNPTPTEGLESFSTACDTLWGSAPCLQPVGLMQSPSICLAQGAGIGMVGENSVLPQHHAISPD